MNDEKNSPADKIVGSTDGLEPGYLRRQMLQASERVRELKLHSPHIFPEWQEIHHAKTALRKAEERYERACKRWHDLGSNAPLTGAATGGKDEHR